MNGLTGITLNDIYFYSPDTAFVVGNNSLIYRSYDGGDTWDQMFVEVPNLINFKSISFSTPDRGIAVGSGNFETMVYTTDGGDSWSVLPKISTSGLTCIEFLNENTALAFGGRGIILKTETGGMTWVESNPSLFNNDLKISPNPFNEYFEIDLPEDGAGDVFLAIFDIRGALLSSQHISSNTGTIKIDTRKLPRGIIIVHLRISNKQYFGKGVKV